MATFLVGVAAGVAVTIVMVCWLVVNRAWRHAVFSGAAVPWPAILGMRLRGTPPALVVDAYVALVTRGRAVDLTTVEASYLAHRRERLDPDDPATLVERQLETAAT